MKPLQWGVMLAVAAWGAGWFGGHEAAAQSLGNGPATTGSAGVAGTSSVLGGPALPLFAPTVPSVMSETAAGSSGSSGLMSSPFAAPFLYSSMMQATAPASATGATSISTQMNNAGVGMNQLGMMMLATQGTRSPTSGVANAVRPGTTNTATARPSPTGMRRTVSRPGGVAARYFNRATARPSYPQGYFNRQTRYFP